MFDGTDVNELSEKRVVAFTEEIGTRTLIDYSCYKLIRFVFHPKYIKYMHSVTHCKNL